MSATETARRTARQMAMAVALVATLVAAWPTGQGTDVDGIGAVAVRARKEG